MTTTVITPAPKAGRRQKPEMVDYAKVALGECGAPSREDGALDFNRHMEKNTLYAEWFAKLRR
ncbi:hypothetical protein [Rhizobium leguminosarum]